MLCLFPSMLFSRATFTISLHLCVLFCALCASARPQGRDAIPNPTATIANGYLVGTATTVPSSTVTVNQFLGVPFAEPPTRFSTPEAQGPWSSALTVTAQPPACIQQFNGKVLIMTPHSCETEGLGSIDICRSMKVFTTSVMFAATLGQSTTMP